MAATQKRDECCEGKITAMYFRGDGGKQLDTLAGRDAAIFRVKLAPQCDNGRVRYLPCIVKSATLAGVFCAATGPLSPPLPPAAARQCTAAAASASASAASAAATVAGGVMAAFRAAAAGPETRTTSEPAAAARALPPYESGSRAERRRARLGRPARPARSSRSRRPCPIAATAPCGTVRGARARIAGPGRWWKPPRAAGASGLRAGAGGD